MKFSRNFLSLCVLAVFAVVVSAEIDTEKSLNKVEEPLNEVEERSLLLTAIAIITKAVGWAVKHCIQEAAQNCREHWQNPTQLVKCAVDYLKENKGRCVIG